MADTGKQSPLGVNVDGSLLQNLGFHINPVAAGYMGSSRVNSEYNFGSIVQGTCLRLLTWAINDAYLRGVVLKTPAGSSVYDNLITIGQGVVESLGNSKPPTYVVVDPSGRWSAYGGPATTGYGITGNTGQGQQATWIPYLMTNNNHSVTQWGFVRCWALQAWNEFNWNGGTLATANPLSSPQYKDFTSSFLTADNFVDYSNIAINSFKQSQTFLKGTYSNMNDLISADITGISLATQAFGQECIALGKAIDLSKLLTFGLPSNLLQTLKKYNAITPSVSVALISAGLTTIDIEEISKGTASSITKTQEQQIYGAFLIIVGQDLQDVLVILNCKTQGLETLADLLNVKKLFPNSYRSLTVPIYNANPGPTNSKTYYPIFEQGSINPRFETPIVIEQVAEVIPPGTPPVIDRPSSGSGGPFVAGPGGVQTPGPSVPLNSMGLPIDSVYTRLTDEERLAITQRDAADRLARRQRLRDLIARGNITAQDFFISNNGDPLVGDFANSGFFVNYNGTFIQTRVGGDIITPDQARNLVAQQNANTSPTTLPLPNTPGPVTGPSISPPETPEVPPPSTPVQTTGGGLKSIEELNLKRLK